MKSSKSIRINKYIADCGITSRRKAEELILGGHVTVNGKKVTDLATKVEQDVDVVAVKGEVVDVISVDHIYLVLNKPRGYMTTMSDPEGRKTIMDLVPIKQRVYPVGRLDYLSEGLIILTNDGDLANTIMHPKFEIIKTYEVKVFGRINEGILKKLRAGVQTEVGLLKPKSVRVIEELPNKTWLEFRLGEGKNREIRRICEGCNVTIDKLRRVAIGGLSLQGIQPGRWEYVAKRDLLRAMGLNKDGSKSEKEVTYFSAKKTIDVKKMRKVKEAALADDKKYERYKKESYYTTLKIQKEAQEKRLQVEKQTQNQNIQVVPSLGKTNYRRK